MIPKECKRLAEVNFPIAKVEAAVLGHTDGWTGGRLIPCVWSE